MDINLLIRGQSNAQAFVERGGSKLLESELEKSFGPQVDVNILASFGAGKEHTIHSATAFLNWDTDGQTAGMASYLHKQPDTVRDNPTVTIWMHNEYDGNTLGVTTEHWVREVTGDAAIMRDELGQEAGTTPYVFTYIPYNYTKGTSPAAIKAGMAQLAADPAFNADIGPDLSDLAMDGDGYVHSSHMGTADALLVGSRLATALTGTVSELIGSPVTPPTPAPTPGPTPAPTPALGTLTAGSGPDALVLKVSQDSWQGNALYKIAVDGVQIGGTFAVSAGASHKLGLSDTLTLNGDWAAGPHRVEVDFLNDGWGGGGAADRNVYVDSASYHGVAVDGAAKALYGTGIQAFGFTEASVTPTTAPTPAPTLGTLTAGSGPDALVLKISQDSWQGNALYKVAVDGVQIGGTFAVSTGASHKLGLSDTLTLKGDWAAGPHRVEVDFLNDGWGGSNATDRNLYVDSASYHGAAVDGAPTALYGTGIQAFGFTEAPPLITDYLG
ncbi:MAG: hypothetical protein JWP04_3223 [Belnapia sp.]|nr:hypothetical protein [Belnapia sp.]